MNFINLIIAFIILGVFFFGFSQLLQAAQKFWENVNSEYSLAKTIYFVSESFKNECIKANRDMESWAKQVSSAKELESFSISELINNNEIWALKAIFNFADEQIEVIGICTP